MTKIQTITNNQCPDWNIFGYCILFLGYLLRILIFELNNTDILNR